MIIIYMQETVSLIAHTNMKLAENLIKDLEHSETEAGYPYLKLDDDIPEQ